MASYKGWINKAKSDLRLAEKGVKDDDSTLDTAIYHTQQCAEKAFKGFLAYHDNFSSKTHDLVKLLELCCMIDPEFSELCFDAAVLSPFATEFRYPIDEETTVERKVVLDAIHRAHRILSFVEQKMRFLD